LDTKDGSGLFLILAGFPRGRAHPEQDLHGNSPGTIATAKISVPLGIPLYRLFLAGMFFGINQTLTVQDIYTQISIISKISAKIRLIMIQSFQGKAGMHA
jgi:hypothetical protein